MLMQRVISGLLFLPIFYLVTWKLDPVFFTALVLIAAVIGQYEFYRMAASQGIRPNLVLGIVAGGLMVVEAYYPFGAGIYFGLFLLMIMAARLFSPRPVAGAIEDISVTFLGIFYVAFLFSFQVAVRMAPFGREWIVFLFFVIWASDIGAYSIGIPFGKHRLYEKVSPKKSIEGLIGALVASMAMAVVCGFWFMPGTAVTELVLLALLLAVVGTIGDLAESLMKRAAGVKDSGNIIPGHGGILDRMDSMLFAAPVLYYYLSIR